ncbi:MAG TPA: GNAT family N-acetyltransferase [Gemmatimonadaceae bacterium]|jgi:GNAT superfamily N-acetyltransferase|nr:GNAT family N-acetyltransferase [Gemmatimonadaceae bacterium]
MATSRAWRPASLNGPFRPRFDEIPELNQVFSDSFTERYRRDGMVGVRVPFLNPTIWRYAIEDADGGAMLWRDERGQLVAFNMVHRSGREGWMGPLAVRTEFQGSGTGKEIVTRGVEWLKSQGGGASVIGLETMPRTMDNIGFYSRLGFLPGRLTLTTTLDANYADSPALVLGRLSPRARDDAVRECRMLVQKLLPGYDYTREISLTAELALGDTILLYDGDRLVGFALAHSAPLVEGRAREELRVLKLALAEESFFDDMLAAIADFARRCGTRRIALRLQSEFVAAYQRVITLGGHVRWTDLRMSLAGYEEKPPARGLVLSNWEI